MPLLGKRSRVDSVLGDRMDEYADYERLTCNPNTQKKWQKMHKLIEQDPESRVVLISVPKGFDI